METPLFLKINTRKMKKENQHISKKVSFVVLLAMMVGLSFLSSCEKDDTGIPAVSSGTPVITGVYLLDTISSYKDSLITGAEPYELLVIKGEHIGGAVEVFFNGYSTTFNPTYNTNNAIIIRVPAEAPTDETATNELKIVTSHGEVAMDFKIIAKPAVYSVDKITFGEGRGNITLKGKNFADVSSVVFTGTTEAVEIVSVTKDKIGNETMVLKFPKTTLTQVRLDITNSSGTITTSGNQFVNADEAYIIFSDTLATGFDNASWGDPLIVNADEAYAGESSMSKVYAAGNWHMAALSNWWPSVEYNADYKFITFAIKGGSKAMSLWIQSDASNIGFGEFTDKNKIDVAPGVWNYYKIAIADLDFWYPGTTLKQMGWRIQGPDDNETFYFDDVMLLK